jgi:hypothetical protein
MSFALDEAPDAGSCDRSMAASSGREQLAIQRRRAMTAADHTINSLGKLVVRAKDALLHAQFRADALDLMFKGTRTNKRPAPA